MPEFMLTEPNGKSYKLTTPDGVTHEDAERELARTMTHQAEQLNPAEPYLKGAKDFARGGVSDVLRGSGVQMPQASNAVGDLLKSDAANTAIGMVNPIKGNFNPNRFASPAAPSNMNVRAGGVKWHANDPTSGGPPEVWTAFDAHDRTLSDIVAEWNFDSSKNEGRYTYKPRLWVKAGKDSISPVDRDVTFDNVADAQRYSEEMLAGGRFDDEAHNAAMSQVGGLTETRNRAENAELSRGQFKMIPERLPQPPSVQRPNRPINQATLDEMRAMPNSAPPLDPRPINPETIAEMRANEPPPSITAFHGSPHDFDRFDFSKIGTGEGAQAYGRGGYFADNEGVARSYRDQMGQVNGLLSLTPKTSAEKVVLDQIKRGMDELGSVPYAGDVRSWIGKDIGGHEAPELMSAFNDLMERSPPGRMYQVGINASPEHFLDWDKPLSEQSDHVRNALKGVVDERNPGSDVHEALVNIHGSDEAATQALRQAGIPGIKYLDQGSRSAGEGSRNYVVFDDKLIDIIKKYGLVGLLGGGVGAASLPAQTAPRRNPMKRSDLDPLAAGYGDPLA